MWLCFDQLFRTSSLASFSLFLLFRFHLYSYCKNQRKPASKVRERKMATYAHLCGDNSDKGVEEMPQVLKPAIDFHRDRFPFCIVWTPIPCLTWLLPFIGHMGICTSSGVIRDFAGPYFVSEDNMAFGRPTKYWQLDPSRARDGAQGWDRAVLQASEEYKGRNHNLFFDNCHSHVARALNLMQYKNGTSWNMVVLAFLMLLHGKYVSVWGFLKTWMPCLVVVCVAAIIWLSLGGAMRH